MTAEALLVDEDKYIKKKKNSNNIQSARMCFLLLLTGKKNCILQTQKKQNKQKKSYDGWPRRLDLNLDKEIKKQKSPEAVSARCIISDKVKCCSLKKCFPNSLSLSGRGLSGRYSNKGLNQKKKIKKKLDSPVPFPTACRAAASGPSVSKSSFISSAQHERVK